jgi:hypothetical protein
MYKKSVGQWIMAEVSDAKNEPTYRPSSFHGMAIGGAGNLGWQGSANKLGLKIKHRGGSGETGYFPV